MSDIVSSPASDGIPHPSQSGHASGLLGESLALGQLPYGVLAEQLHELEADLAVELDDVIPTPEFAECSAELPSQTAPLPGFDTLTAPDLLACPTWCAYGQGHPHGDGFDPYENTAPHRSTELRFSPNHGGAGIDNTGPTEIALQLEQHRDLAAEPWLTLSIAVNGIEQYATLSLAEARTLHGAIGNLLDDTDEDE